MAIDWKTQENYARLLAAIVAASETNVDYKKVAYFFGQGATYDSIERRFRVAKRQAAELKQEAADEGRVMPTAARSSATSTPRKPKAAKAGVEHSVQTGRVQKSPSKSKRGAGAQKVKQEPRTPSSLEEGDGDAGEGWRKEEGEANPFEAVFTHSFSDELAYLEGGDLEAV